MLDVLVVWLIWVRMLPRRPDGTGRGGPPAGRAARGAAAPA
jgi:hypothetical protein